jgi:enediyne biosynthesis protein E4
VSRARVASVVASTVAAAWLAADATTADRPRFEDLAARVGLDFVHVNGATGQFYIPELIGAGAALFDMDNDGDLDLYLLQGQSLGPGAAADARLTHRLYRNDLVGPAGRTSPLRFADVTAESGLGLVAYGMGVAVGDFDGDGFQDLYVTALGPNALFRNNGDGTFTDVTQTAGVDDPRWSTSAAFLDYDRDGDLDLFVTNYLDFTLANNRQCFDAAGARDYCSPKAYRPVPDRLFRNDGNGRFTDVTESSGIARAFGNGLGVSTGDYNGDGWLDIYVANDATPNQLWINARNGSFVDEGPLSGAALSAAGNPEGSMGIASGDFNRDGSEDLFVTNIAGETFVLYVNDGQGSFEDARQRAGVARPTAAFTGFGTDWFDYDNDGWPDLFMANGAVNIVERLRGEPFPFHMRNLLFRNLGTGRFEDVSASAGPALQRSEVSRAAVLGDVDNDGGVDVVVTNNNGPVRLLMNRTPGRGRWVSLRLSQEPSNRFALGARVRVQVDGHPPSWRRVRTDGSYLAASDARVHVGLGTAKGPLTVTVEWPGGPTERWVLSEVTRAVTLRRGSGERP